MRTQSPHVNVGILCRASTAAAHSSWLPQPAVVLSVMSQKRGCQLWHHTFKHISILFFSFIFSCNWKYIHSLYLKNKILTGHLWNSYYIIYYILYIYSYIRRLFNKQVEYLLTATNCHYLVSALSSAGNGSIRDTTACLYWEHWGTVGVAYNASTLWDTGKSKFSGSERL